MRRVAEAALFLGLAAMLHAAAFWAWPGEGSQAAAGEGGDASLTLAGANAATEALVEAWKQAPAVAPPPDAQSPNSETAPPPPAAAPELPPASLVAPGSAAAPEKPENPVVQDSARQIEKPEPLRLAAAEQEASEAVNQESPALSPRPRARPNRSPTSAKPAEPDPEVSAAKAPERSRGADAEPQERAAGSGSGTEAGEGSASETVGDGEDTARLSEIWGGAIRREIERKKRFPRHIRRSGAALVAMAVERSGALANARIARSSGSSGLDEAAIMAVKAAAPYDPAPTALRGGRFHFVLQVNFRR